MFVIFFSSCSKWTSSFGDAIKCRKRNVGNGKISLPIRLKRWSTCYTRSARNEKWAKKTREKNTLQFRQQQQQYSAHSTYFAVQRAVISLSHHLSNANCTYNNVYFHGDIHCHVNTMILALAHSLHCIVNSFLFGPDPIFPVQQQEQAKWHACSETVVHHTRTVKLINWMQLKFINIQLC